MAINELRVMLADFILALILLAARSAIAGGLSVINWVDRKLATVPPRALHLHLVRIHP